MTIVNLMLGCERGGLEQAAIDYAEALAQAQIPSLNIFPRDSWVGQEFDRLGLPWQPFRQQGGWDILAARRLRKMVEKAGASAAICHGNRALSIALLSRTNMKKIAVAHNYKTRRFCWADAGLAITLDARERLIENGMKASRVHYVPNMVRVGELPVRKPFGTPPMIGSMGRFTGKKGFDVYLDALSILARRGVAFRATLGGGGPDENKLRQRLALRGLTEQVSMPGWVENKQDWFDHIDIFVLPSHHEPFGIVLIEAMAAGLPVVSTDSVGPREIIRNGQDGVLFPVADATALANKLEALIADPQSALSMGQRGHARVAEQFSQCAMSKRLKSALDAILTGN